MPQTGIAHPPAFRSRTRRPGRFTKVFHQPPTEASCMNFLRVFLLFSTVLIYSMTLIASLSDGINWPSVATNDLIAFNWRSQFDTDFLIYLLLGATWITWREGFTAKGHYYAFLSVFLGGMFSFPYLLLATFKADGDPRKVLLGIHFTRSCDEVDCDR
ncbi:hypothetical protein-transmembrane prediction [Rhodopirellula baltica SH 1]|uniref:DUF2834 domain-containing protein n=2 Tax=Rhodopirellula baltica TaxID=265606 RepID=Q7UZ99_RHOBA|nr:hypothetical protein-transmembrane prediction [Rhodopirellula baltica SH 1]